MQNTQRNYPLDVLLGVSVADALGVPVEFKSREYLKSKPLSDMIGFGTYNQVPGTWSDDSSLTFCLADSLSNAYNLTDLAQKFVDWKFKAIWTAHDELFDIGNTTSKAIDHLKKLLSLQKNDELYTLRSETDESTNGNGSLMRILPLIFYIRNKTIDEQFEIVWDVSALTHYHLRSAIACFIYLKIAEFIMQGHSFEESNHKMQVMMKEFFVMKEISSAEQKVFDRIINLHIGKLPESAIQSSGYVIHSLEASLWCLHNFHSYKDAVLAAINLGHDTDTTAAITGGLAGLLYSSQNIPQQWINSLAKKDEIIQLSKKLNERFS